jgi:hypothetical protein
MAQRKVSMFAIAVAMLPACAAPALADAIDGNWCHQDGRRLTIRGAEIVTPAGKAMQGDYGRHHFSYMVPAPEPNAGSMIFMALMGENHVRLRVGERGNEEAWVRCAPSISRQWSPWREPAQVRAG